MAQYEVQITESRDLLFIVEADDEHEAREIAMDMDASEATREQFRERQHDWVEAL